MINEYLSGVSATQLSKKYNTSVYHILKHLKKNGINVINRQNEIKWNVDECIKLYHSGVSINELAKLNNVSPKAISLKFKRLKVNIINRHNQTKFNENIFDKIDTQEKAYWLGFIYADGYVSSRDNGFEMSLGLKDLEHLKKFAKFMDYESNIRTDNFRCRFVVSNKHLKNMLFSLGITSKKSLILKFPKRSQVPDELLNHFIRGYFDGDGCIITSETSTVKLRVSVVGTKDVLNKILKNFNIFKKLYYHKRGSKKVLYFSLGIEKSEIFLKRIYQNSTICLERKINLYKNYIKNK